MFKSTGLILLLAAALMIGGCSSPESVEELRAAGKKAYLDEKFREAREYFLKALAQKPSDKDLLYFLASAYQRDSMYDSALFYLQRSNILFPKDRETNQRIYKIALLLEKWEDAISAVNVIAEVDGNIDTHAGELMMLWASNGTPINALYWGRRAIEHDPDNLQWYLGVAQNAVPCDSIELGLAALDSALNRFDSTYTDGLMLQKGIMLTEAGRYAEAERIFRPFVERDSTSVPYRHYLANSLAGQDGRAKKAEALALFKEIQPVVPPENQVDSIIAQLEKDLQ